METLTISSFAAITRQIREAYPTVPFDCRSLMLPDSEPDYADKQTEEFRRSYIAFKYMVAKLLQPKTICEIGVCTGVGAFAFLAACPEAEYLGIDSQSEDRHRGLPLVERTRDLLHAQGYRSSIMLANSQELIRLPGSFDLIHVDGCHLQQCARHDVLLAWEALSPEGYILVDDSKNVAVAAGTFSALSHLGLERVDWAHFEETWTGSILIRKRVP